MWAELLLAAITLNRRIENLVAFPIRTGWVLLHWRLARHDLTLAGKVSLHTNVGVLAGGNCNRNIAQWALRSNSIVLTLVILGALVCCRQEVVTAISLVAMLTFERQEVD